MRRDVEEATRRHMARMADQPFGDTERVSGLTLRTFSVAGEEAAQNLLAKAERALDAGDRDRGRAFAERAARLPFDRREGVFPAAVMGHMRLYHLVTDALEESAQDDTGWLDAAIEVLEDSESAAPSEMLGVLGALFQEHADLTRRERSRLRAVLASRTQPVDPWELRLEPADLTVWLLAVLETYRQYRTALARRAG